MEDRILLRADPILASGPEAGEFPWVRVYDSYSRQETFSLLAYDPAFRGGVRVAIGDVTGDGVPDVITGAGPTGGPHVKVFDGHTGQQLAGSVGSFLAYSPLFRGGIFVASADVNGDHFADIITGADAGGGPHVKVFSGHDGSLLASFMAFDASFTGGVRVAAGDVTGDGRAEIMTATGPGMAGKVRVFNPATQQELYHFQPYQTFPGGIYVAVGDVTGDHRADIVTGPGLGGTPMVRVFDGTDGTHVAQFLAYAPSFMGGVRVGVVGANHDAYHDIVTAPGPGAHALRFFDGHTFAPLDQLMPYGPNMDAGFFVGADDPPNNPPVAHADSYDVLHDKTLYVQASGVLSNDTDQDEDPLTASLVTDVSHGTLSLNADGSFDYTPALHYYGQDSFTYQVSDGTDTDTATVTIAVYDHEPEGHDDSYSVWHDQTLIVNASGMVGNDSDQDEDGLTVTSVSAASHGSVDWDPDGSFTYTPATHYVGADSFTYQMTDGLFSDGATVTITVTNTLPVASNDTYSVQHDHTLTVDTSGVLGNDSDGEEDVLTATLVATVSHGTLDFHSDGSFDYTPATHYVGQDHFTYHANDGIGNSNNATVTINVTNAVPLPLNDSYSVLHTDTLTVQPPGVMENDNDSDGDALTAALLSPPSHGNLSLDSDGSFTFLNTCQPNPFPSEASPLCDPPRGDAFTYQVSDGIASREATVHITLTNTPPVAVDDAYSVARHRALVVPRPGPVGNDVDADGDLLALQDVASSPQHGQLGWNPDGTFVYIPFDFATARQDSFTYRATDGMDPSNPATVTIDIINQPPVVTDKTYYTPHNQLLTVPARGVLQDATDADEKDLDTLTAAVVAGPSHGSLILDSSGAFQYAADSGFAGLDGFTFQAWDGMDASNVGTVTIDVTNQGPGSADDFYHAFQGQTITVAAPGVLGNDSDEEDDPFTASLWNGPSHGTLLLSSDGSFSYTSAATFVGLDSFNYQTIDSLGATGGATVWIDVGSTTSLAAIDDSYTVRHDHTLAVNAAAGVLANEWLPWGGGFSAVLAGSVQHGSLTLLADGSFSYTPTAGYVGPDPFTYYFTDGTFVSNTATASIQVQGSPLGGSVFQDANLSGIRDPGETGVSGVALGLRDDQGQLLDSVLSGLAGGYQFTDVAPGTYTITETIPADYEATTPTTRTVTIQGEDPPAQDFGLVACTAGNDWTLFEHGGSPSGHGGGVSAACGLRLHEGDSFLVGARSSFQVPVNPAQLTFRYAQTDFDTADQQSIKDAFEVELVDAAGQPLAHAYAPGRAAFLNVSDGQAPVLGRGATLQDGIVTLDLSALVPGTTATLVVRLVNNDQDTQTSVLVGPYVLGREDPGTKFFVVDGRTAATFRYDTSGALINRTPLAGLDAAPRGVASNPAGDRTWVINRDGTVWVSDGQGQALGSWQASGLTDALQDPAGITVHGTDLWILDAAAQQVYAYPGAADQTSGSSAASSAFPLSAKNAQPTDLTTDGALTWVTDDRLGEVFVYTVTGSLVGEWSLDGANHAPSGITLDPTGGTDLWIVDRQSLLVYDYANGRTLLAGDSHAADGTFALALADTRPEGIADPPVIQVQSPRNAAALPAGQPLVVSGTVTSTQPLVGPVTLNGVPVAALDGAGHFFTPVTVVPGANAFSLAATDTGGSTTQALTVQGTVPAAGAIDWTQLTDVSASLTAVYQRTSFNMASNVLYADLRIDNPQSYPVDAPLLAAIAHLSDPTVTVFQPDGVTPDGLPYFNFSKLVSSGSLAAEESSGVRSLSFYDPNRVRFSYDLVLRGHPNEAPAFTSVPRLDLLAGQAYAYTATARDPEGDPLHFTLLAGPPDMAVDATTGAVSWGATHTQAGTYPITLQVDDGRGGVTDQDYVLSVQEPPNRPPIFTSYPVVDAYVNTEYVYQATAFDADGDPLTFSVVSGGPDGLTIDATTGVVHWTPTGDQLGKHWVTLQVEDDHQGRAQLPYPIQVHPEPGNHAPIILSDAPTTYQLPGDSHAAWGDVDPEGWSLTLGNGATASQSVTFGLTRLGTPDHGVYHTGDIFVSVGDGLIRQYAPNGTLLRTLDTETGDVKTAGSAFDADGNFYATAFGAGDVLTFDTQGALLGSFGSGYTHPESVAFDRDGNVYVGGEADWGILEFHPDGSLFQQFLPGQEADDLDLSADGSTLYYVSEAAPTVIHTLDVATGGQANALFEETVAEEGHLMGAGFLRILPDDTILVADLYDVGQVTRFQRFNPDGTLQRTYDPPSEGRWFALGLDPDATSFWAGNTDTWEVARIDIDSGDVLETFAVDVPRDANGDPAVTAEVAGLSTFGEIRAATAFANIDIVASDPAINLVNDTGILPNLRPWQGGTFDTTLTGDGQPHAFDLLVINADTGVAVGSLPVALNLPPYLYLVRAADPDGDSLTYSFGQHPDGATIDPDTGRIDWTPLTVGDYAFEVIVEDGRGGRTPHNFTVTVSGGQPNRDPQINSTDPTTAHVGRAYVDPIIATDPDGDRLTYALTGTPPAGMALDADTGQLTWTPTADQVGDHTIRYEVSDGRGGSAPGTFTLTVAAVTYANQRPEITSNPPSLFAYTDHPYRYTVTATDADADPLTFELPVGPTGMVIDPVTGVLGWQATPADLGTVPVLVRVLDGQGGIALQRFDLTATPPNTDPIFTSKPPSRAWVGTQLRYHVRAQDAEHDTLTYSLAPSDPADMFIDSETGKLGWTPPTGFTGDELSVVINVTVTIDDGRGGQAQQTFPLTVSAWPEPDRLPEFTSDPPFQVPVGARLLYQVTATDADNDPLTFALLDGAPTSMTIDPDTGLLTWQTTVDDLGPHPVSVIVDDSRGEPVPQDFILWVVPRVRNRPPTIVSQPPQAATVGRLYAYDAVADEPDQDMLVWSLDDGPRGLSIDPVLGTLRWRPEADQMGTHMVAVRVRDTLGGFFVQTYPLVVRGVNVPPQFRSTPPTRASVGHLYTYAVQAADLEGDPLTFSLVAPVPAGMAIDAATGRISWTPSSEQVGAHAVIVHVDDGQGGVIDQPYSISVTTAPANQPPSIDSPARRFAARDLLYEYDVQASDPDGDTLTYSLTDHPQGMTIDEATGVVQWTPAQDGVYDVTIVADDGEGGKAQQHFPLTVGLNHAPVLVQPPDQSTVEGLLYTYQVQASDEDGDPLTYALTNAPGGMEIDEHGRITWLPALGQYQGGPLTVTIAVADPYVVVDPVSYTLTLEVDDEPPDIDLTISPQPAVPGVVETLHVRATDNLGVTELVLMVDGEFVLLDANGTGYWQVPDDLAGPFPVEIPVEVTATDAATNDAVATTSILVVDPAMAGAPVAWLDALPNDPLTVPLPVTGEVGGGVGALAWTLDAVPSDGSLPHRIASGTGSVNGGSGGTSGSLGTVDTTLLANGGYRLRLTVTDTQTNLSTTEERPFTVAGNLKLGNFTLSFTDLTVPVAGIPITVTRTYDTLDAGRSGDFGFGWHLGFGDAQLDVSKPDVPPGSNVFPDFPDGTHVFVTLPGGQREGFTFVPDYQPDVDDFGTVAVRPRFVADPGVTDQLDVPDVEVLLTPDQYAFVRQFGFAFLGVHGPALGDTYTVMTKAGVTYRIDGETGHLDSASDRNGNELTFTDTAVVSNRDVAITIERDPEGRIDAIVDPRGNRVRYGYNDDGDLASVTDRAGNPPTTYEYDPDNAHYLQVVVDPLGNRVVQAHYNTHGRLDQLQDAQGNLTKTDFNLSDPTNFKAKITDAQDQETNLEIDPRGNVTKVSDAAGHVSTTGYGQVDLPEQPDLPTTSVQVGQDANGNPLSLTTTLHYDLQGNVDRSTDPTGAVTYITYDRFGQPRTITDQLGNTVTNVYDDQGNVRKTISPTGVETTYQFENGNLKQVASGSNATSFTYEFGWLHTSTDANNLEKTFSHDANGNETGSSWTWVNPDNPDDTLSLQTIVHFDANDRPFRNTDEQNNTSETIYDPLGRAFRTIDAQGQKSETVYDDRGLVIQTTSPTGLITRSFYDENGRVSYTTDPYKPGDPHVFGTHTIYTADGQVWKTQRVKDLVIAITGTAPNQRSEVSPGSTVVSTEETQYDSFNRVKLTINQYGLQTQYLYNNVGQQVQVRTESRDEEGTTVWLLQRTVFDEYGPVSIQTDPYLEGTDSDNVMGTRTRYDEQGRVKATDRLQGVQVDLTSDNNTVLVSPGTVLSTTQTGYNDQGQVTETIAANGGVTNYKYEDRGRPSATVGPLVVDAATGEQVRHRTETLYDDNGQVWKERTNIRQSPDGSDIDDSDVRETTHTYDPFGNRIQTKFADNSTLTWTYNTFNEVETETDQVGNTRGFEYQVHQLAAVNLPQIPDPQQDGQLTTPRYEYEYDAFGNQKLIRDALRRETTFAYDGQGHMNQRTLPLGQSERFVYDDLGREKLHISFEGVYTASSYDDMGRLSKKEYFSSEMAYANGAGTPDQTVEYVYDAFSRLVKQTTSVEGVNTPSETTWTNDLEGRVTQIASPEGTINYEYDNLGRKWRMYTGSPESPIDETRYDYDLMGRLATVTVWRRNGEELAEGSREVTGYGYDLVGNLARVDQPNGIISSYQYDSVNHLKNLTHYLPDEAPDLADHDKLAEFNYDPRADGKWDSVTETEWLDGSPHVIHVDWTYDAVGRLTEEVFNHYDDSLDYTADYETDLVGNRLARTVDDGSNGSVDDYFAYAYDNNDRLRTEREQDLTRGTDTTTTYLYGGTGDPATYQTGKTTRETGTGTLLQTVTYGYNLAGQMAQVVTETYAGGNVVRRETASFGYDDNGIRTQATYTVEVDADHDPSTPLTLESESERAYLNDPNNPSGYSQVLRETHTDPTTRQVTKVIDYTWGLQGISQTVSTYANGQPTGTRTTNVFGLDGHGSVRVLMDMAAAIAELYVYDAYGNMKAIYNGAGQFVSTNAANALTTLLYSAQQFDRQIGLQYLRSRYYAPNNGRFNQLDPIVRAGDLTSLQDPLRLNAYIYTASNPINFHDPSGRDLIGTMASLAINLSISAFETAAISVASAVVLDVAGQHEAAQLMMDWAERFIYLGMGAYFVWELLYTLPLIYGPVRYSLFPQASNPSNAPSGILARLDEFNDVALPSGMRIKSVTVVAEPIPGIGGEAALAGTSTNPGTGEMTIRVIASQSKRQIAISIYHEVIEAAKVQLGAKAPPSVIDLGESAMDALARKYYNKLGVASPENIVKMLEELGF